MAVRVRIPDRGYCIALRGGGTYRECFLPGHKTRAVRAARKLAKKLSAAVDVVKVSGKGNYRHVVMEVVPKHWGR